MKIVRHIPNTITSMNLFLGIMGVICTFKGEFDTAFILMLCAALCDFCDGLSARLLNAYSNVGKELDSLADMVSFGLLPAIMLYRLMVETGGESWLCYVPLAVAVLSAIRLAKFNVDERQTENFIGLATPACAMICGAFTYYVCRNPESVLAEWAGSQMFIPVCSVILALLLVSEIPMFSMKFKKGKKSDDPNNILRLTFAAVVVAVSIVTAVLGLNWSLIVLLSFISYIILNAGNAMVSRKRN